MKLFLLFGLLAAAVCYVSANDVLFHKLAEYKFKAFSIRYNKVYPTNEEREYRLEVFKNNLKKIQRLNDYELGTATYDVNEFADLTQQEFLNKYTGLKVPKDLANRVEEFGDSNFVTPESFDWREKGVVSEVKNQGQCGSCWAFSAIGNIEGQWAIKKKQLISLSEQELVDCDKVDQGCNGGFMSTAFEVLIKMGGVETEKDYPYEGRNDKCHFNKNLTKVHIDSYVNLTQDESKLADWLAQNGPIAIGINALPMQFYFGGVSHPWKIFCNPENLNHGVLIVGFGKTASTKHNKVQPYWIIKNSWGKSWGEKGYYRIFRGDGSCGLNRMASSSVVSS